MDSTLLELASIDCLILRALSLILRASSYNREGHLESSFVINILNPAAALRCRTQGSKLNSTWSWNLSPNHVFSKCTNGLNLARRYWINFKSVWSIESCQNEKLETSHNSARVNWFLRHLEALSNRSVIIHEENNLNVKRQAEKKHSTRRKERIIREEQWRWVQQLQQHWQIVMPDTVTPKSLGITICFHINGWPAYPRYEHHITKSCFRAEALTREHPLILVVFVQLK